MADLLFSELSQTLTKQIDKNEKKNNGIYFTPPQIIGNNIAFLQPYMKNIKTVLEPSCGSGEYIQQILRNCKSIDSVTGVELNKTIFDGIQTLKHKKLTLHNEDYLAMEFEGKYDLIIGNPPYFVMKKKDVHNSYYDYFDGRPNIFILFIIKSLNLLNDGGILSFILPRNFLNCLCYNKTRKYINENFKIINIMECYNGFIDTQQDTIILIVQKQNCEGGGENGEADEGVFVSKNSKYSIQVSSYTIFGVPENIIKLEQLYNNSITLCDLGFSVNVGNVVWNQCKSQLTDDSSKTLLIYSSDIQNNKLAVKSYSNPEKKNYIHKKGNTGALLVINRGYGVGSYNFNYCIINEDKTNGYGAGEGNDGNGGIGNDGNGGIGNDGNGGIGNDGNGGIEYLIENHLICIKCNDAETIGHNDLVQKYKKIINSFNNEKTGEFIKLYFGNNAINTTELCHIFPIYDI